MRVILGSQSFIRKKALEEMGLSFEVIPSHFDENSIQETDATKRALILAEKKARLVGDKYPDAIVIGSDAYVHRTGKLFEKPRDLAEAREMLKSLSGTSFEFVAGLAVYNADQDKLLSGVDTCQIQFRPLSDREIERYISTRPVLKCAGAFDVGGAMCFSTSISGPILITSGLCLCRLSQYLEKFGVDYFNSC